MSFRSEIWRDTDNQRAGMLPWVFEPGMGFERYADYALDVPMYFIKRGDATSTCPANRSATISPASSIPGDRATISDWANHVSTIFPEVRLKRYIEMRGSDGGPWRRLPALPAFWVGLIYDDANLDACWEIVKDWTAEERQKLRDDVPRLGFKATIRGQSLLESPCRRWRSPSRDWSAASKLDQQRPRRDALSAAAAGDRGARHHAGRRAARKNTTGHGTARSSRSSTNMRIERADLD